MVLWRRRESNPRDVPAKVRAGRRRLERATQPGVEHALAIIAEHFTNPKKRGSIERAFLALQRLCVDTFAATGKLWVSAERRWLADEAGLRDIETFDRAVADLERLGLIERQHRRLRYEMNLPNLWRLAGVAALDRKPDTGNDTPKPHLALDVDLDLHVESGPALTREAAPGEGFDEAFHWTPGLHEHPALWGLDEDARWQIETRFEDIRERLEATGRRVPEGGWLRAMREWWEANNDDGDPFRYLDDALDDFVVWLDEGGPLSRSFGWMHKYRRVPQPPPSLLFSLHHGEGEESRRAPVLLLGRWVALVVAAC